MTVFRQLLALVRETGMAALIATHNPELAARMDGRDAARWGVVALIAGAPGYYRLAFHRMGAQ